jgi:hypothetical protein
MVVGVPTGWGRPIATTARIVTRAVTGIRLAIPLQTAARVAHIACQYNGNAASTAWHEVAALYCATSIIEKMDFAPLYAGQMHYALTPSRFKLKYLGFKKTSNECSDGFFQGHGALVDPPNKVRRWLRWRFRSETAREACSPQETSGLGTSFELPRSRALWKRRYTPPATRRRGAEGAGRALVHVLVLTGPVSCGNTTCMLLIACWDAYPCSYFV